LVFANTFTQLYLSCIINTTWKEIVNKIAKDRYDKSDKDIRVEQRFQNYERAFKLLERTLEIKGGEAISSLKTVA